MADSINRRFMQVGAEVCVAFRHFYGRMPHKFLDRVERNSINGQPAGKSMPQRMKNYPLGFGDSCGIESELVNRLIESSMTADRHGKYFFVRWNTSHVSAQNGTRLGAELENPVTGFSGYFCRPAVEVNARGSETSDFADTGSSAKTELRHVCPYRGSNSKRMDKVPGLLPCEVSVMSVLFCFGELYIPRQLNGMFSGSKCSTPCGQKATDNLLYGRGAFPRLPQLHVEFLQALRCYGVEERRAEGRHNVASKCLMIVSYGVGGEFFQKGDGSLKHFFDCRGGHLLATPRHQCSGSHTCGRLCGHSFASPASLVPEAFSVGVDAVVKNYVGPSGVTAFFAFSGVHTRETGFCCFRGHIVFSCQANMRDALSPVLSPQKGKNLLESLLFFAKLNEWRDIFCVLIASNSRAYKDTYHMMEKYKTCSGSFYSTTSISISSYSISRNLFIFIRQIIHTGIVCLSPLYLLNAMDSLLHAASGRRSTCYVIPRSPNKKTSSHGVIALRGKSWVLSGPGAMRGLIERNNSQKIFEKKFEIWKTGCVSVCEEVAA